MLQVQEYDPMLLLHVALMWQGLIKHSLISIHCVPFPENPVLHEHVYDPILLLHVALVWHGLFKHSFTSIQYAPFPEKPSLHVQT